MKSSFQRTNAVYYILLLALCIRLIHIDVPVGGFQAWRQADTAAMARNFYENGFRLFYPQIDWGGNTTGCVETEFPIYSFIVALLYVAFSPNDVWGRAVSVVFALVAIYGLYRLVRKIIDEKTALWAAALYAILPLNVYYTRAFMPESGMLMSSVLGIYYFCEWLDRDQYRYYLASLAFISLAALLKIPTLYLGLPLLYLAWHKLGIRSFTYWPVWLYAAAVFTVVGMWYYHAHRIFLDSGLSFGIWFFGQDKWGIGSPLVTLKFYNDVFFKSIAERHLTYPGFLFFLFGLFLPRTTERERLFDWWLVAILVYFAIVTIGNQVHDYYQLPFVLPAVVYMAKALHWFFTSGRLAEYWKGKRWAVILMSLCLCSIPVLSFLRVHHFMMGELEGSSLASLAEAVQNTTAPNALVIAVDQSDPLLLYRSHRKGWHANPCEITETFLRDKRLLGAKYLIGEKGQFSNNGCGGIADTLLSRYPVVKNTEAYLVVRIDW